MFKMNTKSSELIKGISSRSELVTRREDDTRVLVGGIEIKFIYTENSSQPISDAKIEEIAKSFESSLLLPTVNAYKDFLELNKTILPYKYAEIMYQTDFMSQGRRENIEHALGV